MILTIPFAALLERNLDQRPMLSAAAKELEIASYSNHPALPKPDQSRNDGV